MFKTLFFVVFVLTSLLVSNVICTFLDVTHYQFSVSRLETCAEASNSYNLSLHFVNFRVVRQNGSYVTFAGIMDIFKPIQINFRLSVHGLKCDQPEDEECVHDFVTRFGYICQHLDRLHKPWSAFLRDRFVCPIPVGYYDMGTTTVDINAFSALPLGEGYWVIKFFKLWVKGVYRENIVIGRRGSYRICNRHFSNEMKFHADHNRTNLTVDAIYEVLDNDPMKTSASEL